jgi:hypothetical protein
METSDQNENELLKLISDAYKAGNPRKLHGIINMIYDKLNLRKCFLNKKEIEKLNKLFTTLSSHTS